MGSSVQTCAITSLPIQAADPVVGIFLTPRATPDLAWNGSYGTSAAWEIASLPFYGEYDDYGGVDIRDAITADLIHIHQSGISIEQQLSKLKTNQEVSSNHLGMHLILCHAEIWEQLSTYHFDERGNPSLPAMEGVQDFLSLWIEMRNNRTIANELRSAPAAEDQWLKSNQGMPVPSVSIFFTSISTPFQKLARSVENVIDDTIRKGKQQEAESILSACAGLAAINDAMTGLRRHWAPQAGVGSTHLMGNLHSSVAEWTLIRSRKISAEDVLTEFTGSLSP